MNLKHSMSNTLDWLKNHLARALSGIALAIMAVACTASAQLLSENFDFTAGTFLTNNPGWAVHSGFGNNPITVTSPGLTYAGYVGSGVGNAVSMTTTGEDDNKQFSPGITSGSIYAAFLVTASAAQTTGDYFFHFFQTSTIFGGRVWIKKDSASSSIAFGVSKNTTTAASISYSAFNYSVNTTYLVVVKYTYNTGSTTDDSA